MDLCIYFDGTLCHLNILDLLSIQVGNLVDFLYILVDMSKQQFHYFHDIENSIHMEMENMDSLLEIP
jgi:hypothetical protein